MSKYMRSRHIPLAQNEPRAIQEEFDEFLLDKESGSIVKSLRESKGLSSAELADKVGIEEERILLIENGEQLIPFTLAVMFGKIFNVDHHLFF